MSTTTIGLHDVTLIRIGEPEKLIRQNDGSTFYTRHIIFEYSNGAQVTVTAFSDDEATLAITYAPKEG